MRYITLDHFINVDRGKSVWRFKCQKENLELNAFINREPMQIHQDRGYVIVFLYTSNKTRSGVLNILKLLLEIFRHAIR